MGSWDRHREASTGPRDPVAKAHGSSAVGCRTCPLTFSCETRLVLVLSGVRARALPGAPLVRPQVGRCRLRPCSQCHRAVGRPAGTTAQRGWLALAVVNCVDRLDSDLGQCPLALTLRTRPPPMGPRCGAPVSRGDGRPLLLPEGAVSGRVPNSKLAKMLHFVFYVRFVILRWCA